MLHVQRSEGERGMSLAPSCERSPFLSMNMHMHAAASVGEQVSKHVPACAAMTGMNCRKKTKQPKQSTQSLCLQGPACLRGDDQGELPEEVGVGVHEGARRLLNIAPRHALVQLLQALCGTVWE